MMKLFHFGLALFVCVALVGCSSDDEESSLAPTYITWNNAAAFNADGGRDFATFHNMIWDSIYSAKQYFGSYSSADNSKEGIDIAIEHIGDTVKCDWLKIWRKKAGLQADGMMIEAAPNTTGHNRFLKISIDVDLTPTSHGRYTTLVKQTAD